MVQEKKFGSFEEAEKYLASKGIQWFFGDGSYEYGCSPDTAKKLSEMKTVNGDHSITNLDYKIDMRDWQQQFADATGDQLRDIRIDSFANWAPSFSIFAKDKGERMYRISQDTVGLIYFNQMVVNKFSRTPDKLSDITHPESMVCKSGNSNDFMLALWNIAIDKFVGTPEPVPQPASDISTVSVMNALAETMKKTFTSYMADQLSAGVYEEVRNKIIDEFGFVPEQLEVKSIKGEHKVEGLAHKAFPLVLHLIANNEPVYCYGPAGSGKGFLAKQVAEALNLDFYFMNSVTDEFKLTGFINANGHYHETPFFNAFTKGGLFVLDELDASAPEVLVNINMALADRRFTFPTGMYEAHPDFRVIAAGNTLGTGSDMSYTGRFQLDAATLNRFTVIEVGYDERIDNQMADNDSELVEFAHLFRKACETNGIDALCSYRNIRQIRIFSQCEQAGLPTVIKSCVTRSMNSDDISMVWRYMDERSFRNKYVEALKEVA